MRFFHESKIAENFFLTCTICVLLYHSMSVLILVSLFRKSCFCLKILILDCCSSFLSILENYARVNIQKKHSLNCQCKIEWSVKWLLWNDIQSSFFESNQISAQTCIWYSLEDAYLYQIYVIIFRLLSDLRLTVYFCKSKSTDLSRKLWTSRYVLFDSEFIDSE